MSFQEPSLIVQESPEEKNMPAPNPPEAPSPVQQPPTLHSESSDDEEGPACGMKLLGGVALGGAVAGAASVVAVQHYFTGPGLPKTAQNQTAQNEEVVVQEAPQYDEKVVVQEAPQKYGDNTLLRDLLREVGRPALELGPYRRYDESARKFFSTIERDDKAKEAHWSAGGDATMTNEALVLQKFNDEDKPYPGFAHAVRELVKRLDQRQADEQRNLQRKTEYRLGRTRMYN